jgi:hypothetical protein
VVNSLCRERESGGETEVKRKRKGVERKTAGGKRGGGGGSCRQGWASRCLACQMALLRCFCLDVFFDVCFLIRGYHELSVSSLEQYLSTSRDIRLAWQEASNGDGKDECTLLSLVALQF